MFVTTLEGVPVSGAEVRFRTAAASKPLFGIGAFANVFDETLTVSTDRTGIARAWVKPDASILTHAIVRQGAPNEELLGLNQTMAETSGPGTPTIVLPAPFVVLARNESPRAWKCAARSWKVSGRAAGATQPGSRWEWRFWARVLDRYGNWVPNVGATWTSTQLGGRFVDATALETDGVRVLDPGDPAQTVQRSVVTTTDGLALTDYIPGLLDWDVTGTNADLVATSGGASGRFRLYVWNPAKAASPACALKPRRDSTLWDGVFRAKFPSPIGAEVFGWTGQAEHPWAPLTGKEPETRVEVTMDVSEVTSTSRRLISTQTQEPWPIGAVASDAFDDAQTSAFWPTFEVDGGTQSILLRARVTSGTRAPVACSEPYSSSGPNRRARRSRRCGSSRAGSRSRPTTSGTRPGTISAVAFRVTNPANFPIYARIVQEPATSGQTLVALPPPNQSAQHPDDPTLLRLLPRSPGSLSGTATTFTLPLYRATDGGTVRIELFVPDAQAGAGAVRSLGYADKRIRIAPAGTSIAAADQTLRATAVLLVRNFESTATPPAGSLAPDTSTEPPILYPARVAFRVKGNGLLTVTSGGSVLAKATIEADDDGNVLTLTPVPGVDPPQLAIDRSLVLLAPPADPTVHDVTIQFKDQSQVLPFETVIEDVGPLPIGHTLVKDVSVVDGHLQKSFTDVSVPGRNGGLSFSRSYTNRGFETTPMGAGWTHSYHSFVTRELSPGKIRYLLVGGEGAGQVFDCTNPTTGCRPQRGYHGKLELVGSDIVFTARSGTKFHYTRHLIDERLHERTWLTSIVDPRGSETFLEYGGSELDGALLRVFEPGNRRLLQLSYAWPGSASHPKLATVSLLSNPSGDRASGQFERIDPSGVCVAFSHDLNENLTSAARYDGSCSPSAAPLRTETFGYAGGWNKTLRNNLTSYTDPNGKTTGYTYHSNDPGAPAVPGEAQYALMADREERVREVRESAPGGVTTFEYSLVPQRAALLGTSRILVETTVIPARAGAAQTVYRLDPYGASAQVLRGGSVRTTLWDPVHIRPIERRIRAAAGYRCATTSPGT